MYRHTQRSLITPAMSVVALLGPVIAWGAPLAIWLLLTCAMALVAWCGWAFRRMTTEVDESELRAWFGGGWPRYRWPLERIESVRTVTSSVWNGAGIKFTRSGMFYGVAAGPAVEIRLQSGATFRLGSDDAEALAAALRSAARIEAPRTTPHPGLTSRTNALTH